MRDSPNCGLTGILDSTTIQDMDKELPSNGPISLKVSDEQRSCYREAAKRAGQALATWIKDRADVGAIWPPALEHIERHLLELRKEYLQTTRPIDVSAEGWNEFVGDNINRVVDIPW